MAEDPRKHAIPPAPPKDSPERYACAPGACQPTVEREREHSRARVIEIPANAEWLPNDRMWAFTCEHGRPFYLSWQGVITTAEMMDMLKLGA